MSSVMGSKPLVRMVGVILIALMILAPVFAAAQNANDVTGTIINATRGPIQSAVSILQVVMAIAIIIIIFLMMVAVVLYFIYKAIGDPTAARDSLGKIAHYVLYIIGGIAAIYAVGAVLSVLFSVADIGNYSATVTQLIWDGFKEVGKLIGQFFGQSGSQSGK